MGKPAPEIRQELVAGVSRYPYNEPEADAPGRVSRAGFTGRAPGIGDQSAGRYRDESGIGGRNST